MNSSVYCSHGGGLDGYRALPLINSDCGERDKERLASPIIAEAHISLPHIPTFLLSLSHPQEEKNPCIPPKFFTTFAAHNNT